MINLALAVSMAWISISAQAAPQPAGRWEGTIDLPRKQVRVTVDLVQTPEGKWTGSLAFPEVGGTASNLTSVIVKGAMVSMQSMEALCGLDGTLTADGAAITGEFVSASLRSVPVPMRLRRAGQVQGVWEGVLRIPATWEGGDPPEGITRRLRIRLASNDGGATGIFQNQKAELPVTGIVQNGAHVQFEIRASGAVFKAELKGDELAGEWSQFNADPVGLTLKRVR